MVVCSGWMCVVSQFVGFLIFRVKHFYRGHVNKVNTKLRSLKRIWENLKNLSSVNLVAPEWKETPCDTRGLGFNQYHQNCQIPEFQFCSRWPCHICILLLTVLYLHYAHISAGRNSCANRANPCSLKQLVAPHQTQAR